MRGVLFVDDGGVMNDNALRGARWQRLLGEFFPPILGGTPEAWAEANRLVAPRLWPGYGRCEKRDIDHAAYDRAYRLTCYPGAIAAIRHLHDGGYRLHTASGECSAELAGYLEGMGIRHCFHGLYGPHLVNRPKGRFRQRELTQLNLMIISQNETTLR